jgi:DNA-binding PadR family transcriptional regulator
MSLRYAILGLLAIRPRTGYDISKMYDRSITFFWHASHSQIYPELRKLEEEGLVEVEMFDEEPRPRKVYSITEKGGEELLRWLREPTDLPPFRNVFLLKAFFFGLLPKEDILSQLKHEKKLHEDRLATYRAIETVLLSEKERAERVISAGEPVEGLSPEEAEQRLRLGTFWYLTLRWGIMYEEFQIEWCERAIELMSDE